MDTLTAPTGTAAPRPAAAGLIDARLTDITPVAKDTNLYTFRRVDGAALPPYKPGAHIDLHLPNGLIRQFSLTVPNNDPDSYVAGIQRDAQQFPAGRERRACRSHRRRHRHHADLVHGAAAGRAQAPVAALLFVPV